MIEAADKTGESRRLQSQKPQRCPTVHAIQWFQYSGTVESLTGVGSISALSK